MEEHEFKYMMGTQGNPDYLVVAQRGHVGLGVKMLCEGVQDGTFFGMRVRSAPFGNGLSEDADGVTHIPEGVSLIDAWPNIKFGKVNADRASITLGEAINRTFQQYDQLREALAEQDMPGKTTEFLMEHTGQEYWIVSPQDFKEKIEKWLGDLFENLEKKYGATIVEVPECNILFFPDGHFCDGVTKEEMQSGKDELKAEEQMEGEAYKSLEEDDPENMELHPEVSEDV